MKGSKFSMNIFEKLILLLQKEMDTPKPYGWFHLLCVGIMILFIIILYKRRNNHNEKQLKIVLGVYGVIALLLEILKQISWSFNYDFITNLVIWDYEWYSFPFQLCTTPIFVSIICLFLKDNKIRKSLLSYMAFITILGSIATIIIPDSCFTSDILVNIHTMWLHLGSFVVSVYLLFTNEVKLNIKNLERAFVVFIVFVSVAMFFNIYIYNIDVLNGETFNMFYISPYFISSLPVFDIIQENTPYLIFLIIYIFAIVLGSFIICYFGVLIKKIFNKKLII